MSAMTDQVSYLRGLADGLKITDADNTGKLLLAIIDTLGTISAAVTKVEAAQKELDDYVEDIDEDLSEIEEILFSDGEDEDDDDYDDDDDEDDDDEDDGLIEYDCPHCDTTIFFDEEAFSMEEDHKCPNCGKPVFSEDADDDEDGDE